MRPLLNIDLGEVPGESDEFYALAHLANIACGGHAGDDASMASSAALCARARCLVAAHPSYEDRANFGRVRVAVEPGVLRAQVAVQCARLHGHAAGAGVTVTHIKPHGALYHAADGDAALADAVVLGALEALGHALTVVGPAGGALAAAAKRAGLAFARESFADRGVRADGSLIARGEQGALITEPAAAVRRALALASRSDVDTVCVHGDGPGALAVARAVRAALDASAQGAG